MIYLVSNQKELFESDLYKVISAEESINMMQSWNLIQFDSETTGRDAHINKILCIQMGNDKADARIVVDTETIDIHLYKNILESKFLIGQNLKFDLQFLYSVGIVPRGVYDTMIVEQLLYLGYPAGQISYSLKGIAERRLGINIDKTVRGEIIWRGLDTSVILYSAGDVTFLEKIMKSQIEDCNEKKCLSGARLECEFVPAIAYLEWCGIKLDENKWKAKMAKDYKNLEERKKALDLFCTNHPLLKKFSTEDTQGDLFNGFTSESICNVNWSSSRQVVEIAKILGFNTTVQDKKTGEEKDSVLEKSLSIQKGICDEFLKLYFAYQESSKVVSTYGQSQLNMINPNTGRCHTVYRQLGCDSGRMSCGSQNPNTDLAKLKGISPKECTYCNFQQLPADEDTRGAFVSEKGNLFCSCDWSSLEARLGADIYNEPKMIEEYLHGAGDQHSLVAKVCFSKELEGIDVHDVKKLRPDLRKKAKPCGFVMQFGGSAYALSQNLQCSVEEAQNIVDNYMKGFKGINEFKAKGSKLVRKNGYVLMNKYTGHKMYWWDHKDWIARQNSFTPEFWEEYKAYHKGSGDDVEEMVRKHFKAGAKWDRMSLNAPTQGTGSNCLKLATIMLFNWVVENGYFNIIKLCALVHDEQCWEYPKELEKADYPFSKRISDTMQKAAAVFCKSLPIPAEASVGDHWIH